MKKIIFLFLIFPHLLFSQKDENPIDIDFSGFVRGDYLYDTRQNVEACEGLFTLYPLPEKLDENGRDINAQDRANLFSIATRLRSTITGPELFGAKTKAFVEVDFTSNTGTDGFRFRHAYFQFEWEKASLLMGRFWHPLFVTEVFPTVAALNTGAPYQVFNRSPQVRFNYRMGNFHFVSALVYQGDYASYGPNGRSAEYLKNAVLPEFNARLEYINNNNVFGVAGSYKVIQPRLETDYIGTTVKVDEKVEGNALMGYLKLDFGKADYKYKVMLGENVAEHLMFGGYAVSYKDIATGEERYTPYKHLFMWTNFVYGDAWKFGIFGGYAYNLGTEVDIVSNDDLIFARGADIEYSYRIAPHVSYSLKNFKIMTELDYTSVAYGNIDYDNKAKVTDANEIANIRFLLTAIYNF
jgi:hypothetical protein